MRESIRKTVAAASTISKMPQLKSTSLLALAAIAYMLVTPSPVPAQGSQEQNPGLDAPSASKPPSALPSPRVSPRNTPGDGDFPGGSPDGQGAGESAPPPAQPPTSSDEKVSGGREDLFLLTKNVNFVHVPVTVKDEQGQLVPGLLRKDFTLYEDGTEQSISYFTSDPFPLSASVVIDLGMSQVEWDKVRKTLSALIGAFSDFDEVSLYSYGGTVRKMQDYTAATGSVLSKEIAGLKKEPARYGGVPVVGGPLGQTSPTINGRSVDPNVAPGMGPMYRPDAHVLNDAILEASIDLARRDPTRRKILFVISDGRDYASKAGFGEVLKLLLSNQISLYGVGVGGAALPGFRQLSKVDLPGSGTANLLSRYASATGGQIYAELTQTAMEEAYNRITREARNQYTLGYSTRATPSSTYRMVEVVVHRPKLKVYAKDGYYPLPPKK